MTMDGPPLSGHFAASSATASVGGLEEKQSCIYTYVSVCACALLYAYIYVG